MKWLVQALYADAARKWTEYSEHETRAAADERINTHRGKETCFCVELWEHTGCFHAVG